MWRGAIFLLEAVLDRALATVEIDPTMDADSSHFRMRITCYLPVSPNHFNIDSHQTDSQAKSCTGPSNHCPNRSGYNPFWHLSRRAIPHFGSPEMGKYGTNGLNESSEMYAVQCPEDGSAALRASHVADMDPRASHEERRLNDPEYLPFQKTADLSPEDACEESSAGASSNLSVVDDASDVVSLGETSTRTYHSEYLMPFKIGATNNEANIMMWKGLLHPCEQTNPPACNPKYACIGVTNRAQPLDSAVGRFRWSYVA